MSDLEQANNLLSMAAKDCQALRGMENTEVFSTLEDSGQSIPISLAGLLDFTDFAVAFRYDAFADLEGDIDRGTCCEQVQALLDHVRVLVSRAC